VSAELKLTTTTVASCEALTLARILPPACDLDGLLVTGAREGPLVPGAWEGLLVTGARDGVLDGALVTGDMDGALVTGDMDGAIEGTELLGAIVGISVTGCATTDWTVSNKASAIKAAVRILRD